MPNLKSKTSYVTSIGLGLMAIILLAAFWVFLIYKSYSLKSDLSEIAKETASASLTDSYLSSVRNALRGAKDDLEAINKRFIGKDDIPSFIDMLEGKTAGFNLKTTFNSIELADPISGGNIKTLRIRMTGFGQWKDVTEFIASIESMPYVISIKDISISNQKESWSFSATLLQSVTK